MPEEDDNTLKVQMLGGFKMMWQGKPILQGKNLGSKTLHLLLILIYAGDSGVRRERLLEQLYADCDTEQASNSLRATIYRLRKDLAAAGLPKCEYISTKSGIYRWATESIEIELDVEAFQRYATDALGEKDVELRRKLLGEACRSYSGEFLPLLTGDDWVAAANWKYQELFFKCLRELISLLRAQGRYREILNCCEYTLKKFPYEEWQLVKLDSLTALGEYKKALEYYEQIAQHNAQEFGILPSDDMVRRYRAIRNGIQFEVNSIEDIYHHLQPETEVYGATCCDYLTFVDIYRYLVWVLERHGISAYLTLFTIVDKDGVPLEDPELLTDTRQVLETSIRNAVRRADLYSCYGKNQFLMLMTGTNEEGCQVAKERIQSNFRRLNRRKKVMICDSFCPAIQIADEDIRRLENANVKEWDLGFQK